MVNRTFASYRSNIITSGETDVAKWELLVDGDRNSIDLVPGGSSVSYILSVTSKSEVSSTYSIIIDNLPNGVQIALDEGDYVEHIHTEKTKRGGVITSHNICVNLFWLTLKK